MSTRKVHWLAGLMAGVASLAFAEKAADVTDEFIEYLGQMEDSDENWSDFDDQSKQAPTPMHDERSSAASVTSAAHHDEKTAAGKSRP